MTNFESLYNIHQQNVGIFGSNTIVVALSLDRLYLVLRPLGSLSVRGDLLLLLLTYIQNNKSRHHPFY